MKKRYIYNVSFFHSGGQGAAQIICNHKINNIENFEFVKQSIEQKYDLKNVAIINFQLLGKQRKRGDTK